jgi:hypothetical protein
VPQLRFVEHLETTFRDYPDVRSASNRRNPGAKLGSGGLHVHEKRRQVHSVLKRESGVLNWKIFSFPWRCDRGQVRHSYLQPACRVSDLSRERGYSLSNSLGDLRPVQTHGASMDGVHLASDLGVEALQDAFDGI